ncbi:uncharacterized protein METZ01_LOCUS490803, partial [marine metagenome]
QFPQFHNCSREILAIQPPREMGN